MSVENGEWVLHGLAWNDPKRIRSRSDLEEKIDEIGFLPLFGNTVKGFSVEEHTSPDYWWTGVREEDPWEWREIIAANHRVAYGKFFGNKAGFISLKWLPYFVNFRRDGYDFDARYQDGLAGRREKRIMDEFTEEDEDGGIIFKKDQILSTDLKKKTGFGKGGEKNYSGITTGLQMQTYLVTAGFQRKRNKRGVEYGMAVSILLPPESIWGYESVTSAYMESPCESWKKIFDHVKGLFPEADDRDIIRQIGKAPGNNR